MAELRAHFLTVARRKAKMPGWEPFRLEALDGATLVTGGVPRLLKCGPRKGRPTWSKRAADHERVVVTDAETRVEEKRYEAETGKCAACWGEGRVVIGATLTDGVVTKRYRHCPRCVGRPCLAAVPLEVPA